MESAEQDEATVVTWPSRPCWVAGRRERLVGKRIEVRENMARARRRRRAGDFARQTKRSQRAWDGSWRRDLQVREHLARAGRPCHCAKQNEANVARWGRTCRAEVGFTMLARGPAAMLRG